MGGGVDKKCLPREGAYLFLEQPLALGNGFSMNQLLPKIGFQRLSRAVSTKLWSRDKTNEVTVHPTKRSAWASSQSDQSSLCTQWVAKDPSFLHADSKDSDQTGRMPRLV